jgi:hypothetical protein
LAGFVGIWGDLGAFGWIWLDSVGFGWIWVDIYILGSRVSSKIKIQSGMSPYLYDQNIVVLTYEYDSVGSYSELVNIVSSYMRSSNIASQIISQETLRGISVSIATQELPVFIKIIQQGTLCARHAVCINGKFSSAMASCSPSGTPLTHTYGAHICFYIDRFHCQVFEPPTWRVGFHHAL